MYLHKEKTGWKTLRFDSRTYTAQRAREQEGELVRKIPQEYIFIDDKCFMGNGKIKEVILPSRCRIIGKQAFEGCQFRKQIRFPETLSEIKKRAFAENHNLRQASFPASLEKLGVQCYRECNNLRKVCFNPQSPCREIPEEIFDSCVRLNEVTLPLGAEVIQKRAFYRCKELKQFEFPKTMKEIGEEAFYFCGLETLELPEGLEILGDSAFFRCKNLRRVSIPESVSYIGRWVFHGCSRLEYLEVCHDPQHIGPWIVNKSCTIGCYKGSKMDAYCEEYGLKREYISERQVVSR